ncbi:MAG: hypothetical protein KGP28_09790 [Bdellovibrionales bacterium]|nr:hypothetical protein [Bdellovibrionales bacterium]
MPNSKNEKTSVTSNHEISVSDFSEDVPGVTQLLTPNLASLRKNAPSTPEKPFEEKEKTIAINLDDPSPHEQKIETSSNTNPNSQANPLATFEIEFQLIFTEEGGVLRYQSVKEIGKSAFPRWKHSFFKKMKIEVRTLGISVSFQEFAAERFPFQREAFGMAADDFVQCVRDPKDRKKIHVLFSKKSQLSKKNEIEEALAGIPGNGFQGSGDIKIELDT